LQATRVFGKLLMNNLLQAYKNILVADYPRASLQNFINYHAHCFSGVASRISMKTISDKSVKILLTLTDEDKEFVEAATAFAEQLAGNFEELTSQAGGKNVKLDMVKNKDNNYEYSLSWE